MFDWLGHPHVGRMHHIAQNLCLRHEVHVVRFGYAKEKLRQTKCIVHEVPGELSGGNLASYYLKNVGKHRQAIVELLRKERFDCVIESNLFPSFTTVRALDRHTFKVYDLPDHFPSSATGYFFDLSSFPGKISETSLQGMLSYIIRRMDCTISCSSPLKAYASKIGAKDSRIVPNGVAGEFIGAKKDGDKIRNLFNVPKSALLVGFVGMIEFWVNFEPLLQALRSLRQRLDIRLLLVGKGYQTPYASRIRQRTKELHIDDIVLWTDHWIPYEELPDYLSAMDLCVLPFRVDHPTAYYSSPNKVWEYLAFGKPVISTPIPDLLTNVSDNVSFVQTREDYENVLLRFSKDPEPFIKRAQNAIQKVRQRNWSNISNQYENELTKKINTVQVS
jgi:glycosyltransferase involved in cell wall biosynthesis